jgi:hypothetical protein
MVEYGANKKRWKPGRQDEKSFVPHNFIVGVIMPIGLHLGIGPKSTRPGQNSLVKEVLS